MHPARLAAEVAHDAAVEHKHEAGHDDYGHDDHDHDHAHDHDHDHDRLSLSDQDVDILHQIITRAEQHPDVQHLPFRAIFTAYDDVLREHGLDPRRDQVCFRFLFQLGSRGLVADGRGLYGKFVTLLSRMGIQLVYEDDDEKEGQVQDDKYRRKDGSRSRAPARAQARGAVRPSKIAARSHGQSSADGPQTPRRRRASFNSVYDATDEVHSRSQQRPSSRSSVSRLEGGTEAPRSWREDYKHGAKRPRDRNGNRKRKPSFSQDDGPSYIPRRHAHDETSVSHPDVESQFERYGKAARGRGRRDQQQRIAHTDSEETTSSLASSEEQAAGRDEAHAAVPRAEPPLDLVYRPSLSDLLRDASTFNMYRERNVQCRLLRHWRDTAIRHRALVTDMYQLAARRDGMTLTKQALELWHARLLRKKQTEELDRFFKHLEIRATRARDLYLLGKTLAVWRARAAAETARLTQARRQILEVKYFNAWRSLTAANELQVQRFTLRGPLRRWQARAAQLRIEEQQAALLHVRHLKQGMYWRWFWAFCYQRAPVYKDQNLKHKFIILWIRALRRNRERELDAATKDNEVLLQSSFQAWRVQSEVLCEARALAQSSWRQKRLLDCFTEWHVRTRLGRPAAQVEAACRERRLRLLFDVWHVRAQAQRQAKALDRYRLMRSAWRAWNYNLRVQALAQRIDERIVMQVLYKWLLVARQHMMQRIHEQRLMKQAWCQMFVTARRTFSRLLNREEKFRVQRRDKALLRRCVSVWQAKLQRARRREETALAFYAPRLQLDILTVWQGRLEQLRVFEDWAAQARYHSVMTEFMRRWRNAAKESAKKHRLEAYAIIRRRYKMNLALSILVTWKAQAQDLREMQAVATRHHHDAVMAAARTHLHRWYELTGTYAQHMHDAQVHHNRRLVQASLDRLLDAHLVLADQQARARQFYEAHVSRFAGAQLRKLSLRLFQVRANAETADRQKERFVKKSVKGVFRQWLAVARNQRLAKRSHIASNSSRSTDVSRSTNSLRSTLQAHSQSHSAAFLGSSMGMGMGSSTGGGGGDRSTLPVPSTPMPPTPAVTGMATGATPATTVAPMFRPWSRTSRMDRGAAFTPLRQDFAATADRPRSALSHSFTPAGPPPASPHSYPPPLSSTIATPAMPLTPAPAPASTTPAYASEHATPAQAQAQAQAQDYGPTSSNALSAARRRRPQLTIRTKRFSAEPSTTPASQAATPVAARHILGQLTNGSNSVTPRAKAADGRRRGMLVNGDGGATPRDSSSWPPATTTPAAMARSGPTTTPQHAASTTPVGNGYSVGPGMGGRGMHRRGGRGHSSLATVRFADDDSEEDSGDVEDDEDDVDPEAGSPSKGRSTLRSSITRHP